jgi:hypothetical protein
MIIPFEMSAIDIKQEALVPNTFKFFGLLLIIGGLIALRFYGDITVIILRNMLSIGLIGLGAFLASAYYGLRIDVDNRTYTVYTFALGWKMGKPIKFESIELFYINRVKMSSRMNSYGGHKHTDETYTFNAYMKLNTGNKVHLDTDSDEGRLAERVEVLKEKLASITQLER